MVAADAVLGIDWAGVNAESVRELLLSVIFVAVLLMVGRMSRWLAGLIAGRSRSTTVQTRFWTRQGISRLTAVVLIFGTLSIWFNDPTWLATTLAGC